MTMNKYEVVRRNYNSVNAELHNKYDPVKEFKDELEYFASQLPQGAKVLVIGGVASECNFLIEKGFEVTNVDVSSKMLTHIKHHSPETSLVEGSIHQFPTDRTFDGVLAVRSLIHIPLSDLDVVLNTIKRLLSPGGTFMSIYFTTNGSKPVEEEKSDELADNADVIYYRVLYPMEHLAWMYDNIFEKEPVASTGKDMDKEEYLALSVKK